MSEDSETSADETGGPANLRARITAGPAPQVLEVLEWMGHACHGLNDLHAGGHAHGDIKPEHLWLTDDADRPLHVHDPTTAVASRSSTGTLPLPLEPRESTPAYRAPECFAGAKADPCSDIYSLGITFAEILLGRHPLAEPAPPQDDVEAWAAIHQSRPLPDLRDANAEIPDQLQAILQDCTARERADRIPDAIALWSRLKQAWNELTATAARKTRPLPDRPTKAIDTDARALPARSAFASEEATAGAEAVGPGAEAGASGRGGALLKGLVVAGGLLVVAVVVIGVPLVYVIGQQAELQRERERKELELARLEAERAAELERRAEEERRAREEAERKAREAAEQARLEAERKAELEQRAKALGVQPVEARIDSQRTLDKLLNAQRFGSHWLYMFENNWGRASVEEVGGVYFFEGTNTRSGASITLEGVVTEVTDRGVVLDGTVRVRFDDDPPCGWSGKHRLNLPGHPNYFRAQVTCEGRHHYVDLFVDDDWLKEHPE